MHGSAIPAEQLRAPILVKLAPWYSREWYYIKC